MLTPIPNVDFSDTQHFTLIQQKSFHHNNLLLQIYLDKTFHNYDIIIHRQNDNTFHQLFGYYHTLKQAQQKFDKISL